MTHIDVYVDVTSPGAYLSFEPTLKLIDELGATATWQPTTAPKQKRAAAKPEETVAERHQRVRAEYRDSELERYAKWRGLPFRVPTIDADDVALASGILAAGAQAPAFLATAFEHYWQGGEADMDQVWVDQTLASMGCQPGEAASATTTLAETLEAGAWEAPAYRIEGELFIGRQHLPLIARIAREGLDAVIPPIEKR